MGDKFKADEEKVSEHLPRAKNIEWRHAPVSQRQHRPFSPKAANQPVGTTIDCTKKRFSEVKNSEPWVFVPWDFHNSNMKMLK